MTSLYYHIQYEAQASGLSKRQAQPCASRMVNIEKKSNSEAKILKAVGGFCKIKNLSRSVFQNLVNIDERQQLTDGQIRALVNRYKLWPITGKKRCKFHGGKSTGPKTEAGKFAISKAQKERWIKYRQIRSITS